MNPSQKRVNSFAVGPEGRNCCSRPPVDENLHPVDHLY